ncbi:hypothetical protein [Pseudomonas nicosulfuronedens]
MRYIDNWCYALSGAMDSAAVALPVPPAAITRLGLGAGDVYTLTIVDTLDPLNTAAVEILTLTGQAGGTYLLSRPAARGWPAGSVVFAGITAAMLAGFGQGGGGGAGLSGAGWPETPPPAVGATYLDTEGPGLFAAVGVADVDDWRLVSGMNYNERSDADYSVPYEVGRWTRDVMLYPTDSAFTETLTIQLPAFGGGIAGVQERMELRMENDEAFQCALDFSATVARQNIGFLTVQHNLTASDVRIEGASVIVSLTGSSRLELVVDSPSTVGADRWGFVRLRVSEMPFEQSISSSVS